MIGKNREREREIERKFDYVLFLSEYILYVHFQKLFCKSNHFFFFYSAVQAPKYDANATVDNDDDDDGY